jgi:glutathione S-transferase
VLVFPYQSHDEDFTLTHLLQDNPRTTAIKAVAKANNLELNIVDADPQKPTVEHLKANALGKVPAFLGEDGFALSEAIAVAIYRTYNFLTPLLQAVLPLLVGKRCVMT